MENKVLKKILVMAIVFVIMFSNCGVTLQALATSDGISIFGFTLFGHDVLKYKAYFLDENGDEKDEMQADVNGEMTLVLELEPNETGYLKTGTIKAITDEGKPNFEFKEILNLSTNSQEEVETLEQTVQLEQTLLQSEQTLNTDLPEIELDIEENEEVIDTTSTQNTVENTVPTENTVENEVTVENVVSDNTVTAENTVTEEPVVQAPTTSEEPEVLVNEEEVYQEEVEEKDDTSTEFISLSSAKVNTADEIIVENIIEPTKIFVKIAYQAGETLKASDLYKEVALEVVGKYINEDLEEMDVTASDSITVGWTYSKDISVSSEITKVSPFEVEGTKGTLVESTITVRRDCVEEKYLPLKETVIEFEAPHINGKLPVALDVSANKLKATRGEEIGEVTFSSENWSYDQDRNIITIKVENPDCILTSGEDIYKIIYRYDEYVESKEIKVSLKGTVTVEELSGNENNIITKEISDEKTSIVNIGELITYSIGTTDENINRAKINANYNSVEAEYETEFTSTVSINILTNDVLKEFVLKDTKEFYVDKSNLEFETKDVRYKSIKFRYDEISEILNQGGIIEIKANTGELLYTLNSQLIKSQEQCEIILNGDIRGVEISVKEIKVNGTITVDFVKSIGKCSYDKSAFNNFEKIESRIKAEVKYGLSDEVIELTELKTEKYFEKSYTNAEISMNKEELSTILDNEDVEIKIELNNHQETSDLYINPEFEVVFPSFVTDVEVKAVNLLYEEGLTVKNITLFKDNNIQKMKVQLEGVQRNFSTSEFTNGTNIIINVKIVVDDYTPKKVDQIKMYYINQGVTNYQAQSDWKISSAIPEGILKTTNGFDVEVFSYQAPTGFITANGIENYDGLGSTIQTIKQGEVTAKAGMGESSRVVTMNLAALNNTGNECTDVAMLGRIPSVDATDVITGQKLGTNRDTQLVSEIIQADSNPIGCDIYYSENANASRALSDTNSGWTKTPADMTKVKSFLIVPTSEVKPGTVFKFSYNFLVAENLPYDVEMYGAFGAYYNNHTDVAVVYESTKADLVGLVTDSGPKVEATLSVDIGNGAKILSARRMKYIVTVVNSGSITATNVNVKVPIPAYTQYIAQTDSCSAGDYGFMVNSSKSEVSYDIGNLNPGEAKSFEFYVKTSNKPSLEEYAHGKDETGYYMNKSNTEKEYITEVPAFYITNQATVTTDILANPIISNEVKNELVYANFDTSITLDYDREMIEGYETNFNLVISNIARKDLKNVVAVFSVGNVYSYVSGTIDNAEGDISFNAEEGKIYFKIPEIKAYANHILSFKLKTKNISKGIEEYNCRFEITADGMTSPEYSTSVYQCIKKGIVSAKDNTINPKTSIKEGETIVISTEVSNIGQYIATDASFECEIPNNMEVISVESSKQGNMSIGNETGKIEDSIQPLKVGEAVTIDITLKAKNMEGTDPIQVVLNRVVKQVGQQDINIEPYSFTVLNTEKTEVEKLEEERKEFEEAEKEYEENNKQENNQNNNVQEPNVDNNNDNNNNNNPAPETNNNNDNNNNNNQPNTPETNENNQPTQEENNTPTEPVEEQKYSIKGIAWLDENKNGARENEEKGLPSVKVYLLTVGHTMVKSTTTDSYGVYRFEDVENGKYVVAFAYDSQLYTTTVYKKAEVSENDNSDVIESEADDINAISNTITVENADIEHIDIGLQNKDIFDLQITKYLSKAKVTTNKGTKEYKYDNVDLAKIDIHSRELKDAVVELEYTISIENKGSIEGYADQVVDYIGSDIKFDESKNKDWYKGNDGYIYIKNSNQVYLKPGATKEYKLNVTKEMTEENTGVLSNKVEIVKAFNNSNETEVKDNNTSVQNTIITVSTGTTLRNVIIIIFIIAVLAGLGYSKKITINISFNKVYKKSKDKKTISFKKFYK